MILISLALGILFWTFLEYMLHRFLGHQHKGKNFFKKEHVQHHARFNYFAPAYKKGILFVLLFSSLLLLGSLVFPFAVVFAFLFGFFAMASLYEYTHFRYHSKDPVSKIFIVLRKHHFYHHFHNPMVNHGVTSRIWDRVFGTFIPVERVNIPLPMLMGWLVDDNELKPKYASHFRIVGKQRNPS